MNISPLIALSLVLGGCSPHNGFAAGGQRHVEISPRKDGDEAYPYHGQSFTQFVTDSVRETRGESLTPFYTWMDKAYSSVHKKLDPHSLATLAKELARQRTLLASIKDLNKRTAEERRLGVWLHRLVKTVIPKFSLDRGSEFTNTVRYGERQCFLQSVLIAGLAQSMGIDAGVYMVWKNEKGSESNNGHAVSVLKLSNGHDLLVDASDPAPFMRHQGLFVVEAQRYRFARPRYNSQSEITTYLAAESTDESKPRAIRTLDRSFLRSQFYFYRGERSPGGFLGTPKTNAGLRASAKYLSEAIRICPQNSLAVYVLGHAYARLGKQSQADAQFIQGYRLYLSEGYVPPGAKAAYAEVKR
ncbi:MAG: hypothetical protein J0H02_08740 [Armatimonadetes bacterium]|nr:hypothetical protein [Armatimonadota bacterium]